MPPNVVHRRTSSVQGDDASEIRRSSIFRGKQYVPEPLEGHPIWLRCYKERMVGRRGSFVIFALVVGIHMGLSAGFCLRMDEAPGSNGSGFQHVKENSSGESLEVGNDGKCSLLSRRGCVEEGEAGAAAFEYSVKNLINSDPLTFLWDAIHHELALDKSDAGGSKESGSASFEEHREISGDGKDGVRTSTSHESMTRSSLPRSSVLHILHMHLVVMSTFLIVWTPSFMNHWMDWCWKGVQTRELRGSGKILLLVGTCCALSSAMCTLVHRYFNPVLGFCACLQLVIHHLFCIWITCCVANDCPLLIKPPPSAPSLQSWSRASARSGHPLDCYH